MCSDGVNEVLEDTELVTILCAKNLTVEEKFFIIQNKCELSANDNNSAILIQPVSECKLIETYQKDDNIWVSLKGSETTFGKLSKIKQRKAGINNKYLYHHRKEILIYSVVLLVIMIIIYSLRFQKNF